MRTSAAAYDDFLAGLSTSASALWAIQAERLDAVSSIVADAALGRDVVPARLAGLGLSERGDGVIRVRARGDRGSVAVVPVSGLILFGAHLPPFATATTWLRSTVQDLAADPDVKAIIVNTNSPGGTTAGVMEAAATIREARTRKNVVALSNWLAASAAFWICASASKVYALPSSSVASVGVFSLHLSFAEQLKNLGVEVTVTSSTPEKTEMAPFTSLTADAKANEKREVLRVYGQFLRDLSLGRGVSTDTIRADYGNGRTLAAQPAKLHGVIDAIVPGLDALVGQVLSTAALGADTDARLGRSASGSPLPAPAGASADGLGLGSILQQALRECGR